MLYFFRCRVIPLTHHLTHSGNFLISSISGPSYSLHRPHLRFSLTTLFLYSRQKYKAEEEEKIAAKFKNPAPGTSTKSKETKLAICIHTSYFYSQTVIGCDSLERSMWNLSAIELLRIYVYVNDILDKGLILEFN